MRTQRILKESRQCVRDIIKLWLYMVTSGYT